MKNSGIRDFINVAKSLMEEQIDNKFYKLALEEYESGNTDKGTWAKSLTLADGDENKAKSKYIQLRARLFQIDKNRDEEITKQAQYAELDIKNEEFIEEQIDKAIASISGFVGVYMILGSIAIGIFILNLIVGFEPTHLLILLAGLLLLLPIVTMKFLAKNRPVTLSQSKKRVRLMFVLTIIGSLGLYVIGLIFVIYFSIKLERFNKAVNVGPN